MTAAVVTELSSAQAQKLWAQLQQHFINAGRVIEEIIERRAWEPMGYASFAEAWSAQMGEITLATEVRAHVVYQLLAEGYDYDAISRSVKGIGRDRAAALDRQRRNGVPARDASLTVVREHERKKPSAPSTIHVAVGPIAYRRFQKLADSQGKTVEQIAEEAIRDRFKALKNV